MNCRFEEPGHKVLVEERCVSNKNAFFKYYSTDGNPCSYLQELQQKAQVQQQNVPAAKRSAGSVLGEDSEANSKLME